MGFLRSILKYHIAAALLNALAFACSAGALVLVLREGSLMALAALVLTATVLNVAAARQLRTASTVMRDLNMPLAAYRIDWTLRRALVASLGFFVIMVVSSFASAMILLYTIPELRPSDDFPIVELLSFVSVSYALLVTSFFFGGIRSSVRADS